MTEQHRRNDEDAPTQSNPPDAPDMYVVVATATKLCTASPLKSEVATLTMLVEAKSDAEAVRVAQQMALGVAGECSAACHRDLPFDDFEDAQEFFASKGLLVPSPIVERLSEVPALCASCLEQEA